MTANRDLKRRVRERQSRTGESYMVALDHVLAQRPGLPSTIPTVEFVDVSRAAAGLGLKSRMTMSPTLVHEIDVDATVRRFRDLLLGAPDDPSLDTLRRMALMGEHPKVPVIQVVERTATGFLDCGGYPRSLAIPAVCRASPGRSEATWPTEPADDDEDVAVFSPWPVPVSAGNARPPLIVVSAPADVFPDEVLAPFRR